MSEGRSTWYFMALVMALLAVLLIVGITAIGGGNGASRESFSAEGPSGEGASAMEGVLAVFAAASLSDAFEAMGQRFETEHPGVRVTFNFAGSQQLAQQLAQGAPGDVFASANPRQMTAVIESGRIGAEAAQTFAHNRLVVALPMGNPAGVSELRDLARPGVRLALADAAVPAGRYALTFLERAADDAELGADFQRRVLENVVSYEQNVRAVLTKIALGEADAGIVYASDVAAAEVVTVTIPERLNPMASYPIAPLEDAERPALARAFVDFVLSEPGQEALAGFGFIPARPQEAADGAPTEDGRE